MGSNHIVGSAVLAIELLVGAGLVMAQEVEDALAEAATRDEAARRSQARVDEVADETRDLVRQYSAITKEIDGLHVYDTLLQR